MAELSRASNVSNVGEAGSPEQGPAGKGQGPIRSPKAKPSKASAEAVGRTTATPEKGARSKGTPIVPEDQGSSTLEVEEQPPNKLLSPSSNSTKA